jgi:segregation and condensation protein B
MNELKSKIESLLFLSGRPMSERELAELTKGEIKDIAEAGRILMAESLEKKSGLQIIKNGTSFQMVTAPENAELVQQFVKDETTGELSRPSLETLTIIAYRGPVAKTDLDRIRGINCSLILRNLLIRGLIDSREDKKKDESYYTVTFDFLRFLGLNNVNELPDFQKLSQDDTIERILEDNPLAEKINNNQQTLDLPEEIAAAEAEVEKETDDSDDQDADDDDDDEDEDEDEDELAVIAVSGDGDTVVVAEVTAGADGKDTSEDENEEVDEDQADDDDEFEDDEDEEEDEDEGASAEATADKEDE